MNAREAFNVVRAKDMVLVCLCVGRTHDVR